MNGTEAQALNIISILKGIKPDELAAVMMVPREYMDEVCQGLLTDEVIMKSAKRDGLALKAEARTEVLELINTLRIGYIEEISKRLAISEEFASYLCQNMVEDGILYKSPQGGYLLREDREAVFKTIKELKKATAAQISKKLDMTPKHAKLLCKSLEDDYSVMKTSKGEYTPAERDVTRVLRLIKEYGWAPIGRITRLMKITPAYADLLCRSLAEQGYLKKAHPEAYALVGRKDE